MVRLSRRAFLRSLAGAGLAVTLSGWQWWRPPTTDTVLAAQDRIAHIVARGEPLTLPVLALPGVPPAAPGRSPLQGEEGDLSPALAAASASIQRELERYAGDVAFAVTDLVDGEHFGVNEGALHITGCTINMFVLYSVVKDMEAGGYAEDRDLWWLIRSGIGGSWPPNARRLVIKTGGGSLWNGLVKIDRLIREQFGLATTVYDHVPGYYREASLYRSHDLTTARDIDSTLARLYRGELFSKPWTDYTLNKLSEINANLNNVIPSLLPKDGVRVAHKIGFVGHSGLSVYNDAGIVMVQRNGSQYAYTVTFLSQRNAFYWAAPALGARLSRLVFDAMEQKYARPAGGQEGSREDAS